MSNEEFNKWIERHYILTSNFLEHISAAISPSSTIASEGCPGFFNFDSFNECISFDEWVKMGVVVQRLSTAQSNAIREAYELLKVLSKYRVEK